jgi:aspartate kinase
VISHIKILKFGGTSVSDASAFARAAKIVSANRDGPVVVIVSAMNGVTDALIKSLHGAISRETLDEHFERHLKAAQLLDSEGVANCHAFVDKSRREIFSLLDSGARDPRMQDAVAAYGEMLSARLFTMTLGHHFVPSTYVDARRCILTDDRHGSANPLSHEVRRRTLSELNPLLEANRVAVMGGFMGATAEGVTTTLGRGSSDYSATLIGAALGAGEIQIWTDVDGVQTADPAVVSATRTIPTISYQEAGQLAALGARVMHPKMIEPVIANQIPVVIRNSRDPEQRGTVICAGSERSPVLIKAIAHRVNGGDAVIGCVGDGLSNGSADAAEVRRLLHEIDPALKWKSTATSNLVTTVARDRVSEIVRSVHARFFEDAYFRAAAPAIRSTSCEGDERP